MLALRAGPFVLEALSSGLRLCGIVPGGPYPHDCRLFLIGSEGSVAPVSVRCLRLLANLFIRPKPNRANASPDCVFSRKLFPISFAFRRIQTAEARPPTCKQDLSWARLPQPQDGYCRISRSCGI
jgi:hypothetical protein